MESDTPVTDVAHPRRSGRQALNCSGAAGRKRTAISDLWGAPRVPDSSVAERLVARGGGREDYSTRTPIVGPAWANG